MNPSENELHPFLYYPRKNGAELGQVPTFYYPGPRYGVVKVKANTREYHGCLPPGTYLKKAWKDGTVFKQTYEPYTEERRRALHYEIEPIYERYKKAYESLVELLDMN
ncbi:hypothetical protein AAVH_41825, partial [Aphelenchoides avenae]